MKDVYLVAAETAAPLDLELLQASFDPDEVEFIAGEEGIFFSIVSDDTRIDVRFKAGAPALNLPKDLITGSDRARKALKKAKSSYLFSFDPGKPQPSVAVRVTVYVPAAGNVWLIADEVLVGVPSPKFHR